MKFTNIIDVAFTGPERNAVCFNALKELLRGLVAKLNLALDSVPLSEKEFTIPGPPDPKRAIAFLPATLLDKVNALETVMYDMQEMHSNEFLVGVVKKKLYRRPVLDMWTYRTIKCNIACNDEAVDKLFSMVDEMEKETAAQKDFVNTVREALMPPPVYNDAGEIIVVSIKDGMKKLNQVIAQFDIFKLDLAELLKKMGDTHLPDGRFYLNYPSWYLMEGLLTKKYRPNQTWNERVQHAQDQPSDQLTHYYRVVGNMIEEDKPKLGRIRTMELQLTYFNEIMCTKEEMQKLVSKMSEIQGIAGAVDRLMCRIQGTEDQVCCLRQISNRIYGCIAENTGEDQGMMLCMGMSEKKPKTVKTAADSLKDMKIQFEKIQCDLDSSADALVQFDTLKIDIQNLFAIVNELDENKLEKTHLTAELSQKADKCLVDEKLSSQCFEVTCDGFNAVINDVLAKILESDLEWQKVINHLSYLMESKVDRDDIDGLKEQIENKLKCIAKRIIALQNQMGSMNASNMPSMKNKPIATQQCLSCDRQVKLMPNNPIPSIPSPPGLPGRKIIRMVNAAPSLEVRNMATLCSVRQNSTDPFSQPRSQGGTSKTSKVNMSNTKMDDGKNDRSKHLDEQACKNILDPENQLLYSPATGPQLKVHSPPAPTRSDMKEFVKCLRDILDQAIVRAKAAAANSKSNSTGCGGFLFNSNKSNNLSNNSNQPVFSQFSSLNGKNNRASFKTFSNHLLALQGVGSLSTALTPGLLAGLLAFERRAKCAGKEQKIQLLKDKPALQPIKKKSESD